MGWLLFLSRVAFVCNLFFLLSFSLQVYDWIGEEGMTSTVMISGYLLSFLFNPAVIISYLFYLVKDHALLKAIPLWLIVLNVIFLFLQIVFILLLNVI